MKIFNYGIKKIEQGKFINPSFVNEKNNKINGGIWASKQTELYSDWFVITLYVPQLLPQNSTVEGNIIHLKDNANILTLTKENYKEYTSKNILDFNKLKKFDVVHFSKSLMDLKKFEAYYFECYQILNYKAIENVEKCDMDTNYILSDDFKEKASKIFDIYLQHVKQTDVFKEIFELVQKMRAENEKI